MPSGASAASRDAARPASLTFLRDHQIGRFQVAAALRAIGARVEVHLDHFAGNTPDAQWIPEIGRRDWVLITKDQDIRRNPLERAAYESAKLRGFIVTGKDMTGEQLGNFWLNAFTEWFDARLAGLAHFFSLFRARAYLRSCCSYTPR